ncbi:hypothetical protein MASR2M44_08960 [Bacteroidota bacterium]
MKSISIFSAMLLAGSLYAQEKNVKAFTKLELEAPLKVELIRSTESKIDAGSETEKLGIEVEGNTLSLEMGSMTNIEQPVKVYYTQLEELEINGIGDVRTREGSVIEGASLEIEANGASKLNLNVKVDKLKIESAGASKLTLAGQSKSTEVELAGASKLMAGDLKTENLKLEAAGAVYFNVNVSKELTIEAAGASKGVYAGNPQVKTINVTGLSKVVDASTGEQLQDERNNPDGDTTKLSIGKKKVIIYDDGKETTVDKHAGTDKDGKKKKSKKEMKTVYSGFEVGMNSLIQPGLEFSLPQNYSFLETQLNRSWFYGLNLFEGDLHLVKNTLALTSGLGMEFQTFEFNTNRILTPNVDAVTADNNTKALNRNRMYNFNFNAPVLIKFAPRTAKGKEGFHLAVGVIGTYKARSLVRTETTADGYEVESKIRDDYNINPFRVSATARVGYKWFRAFANYSLTPYFDRSVGSTTNPDIRVFQAGITVIPF